MWVDQKREDYWPQLPSQLATPVRLPSVAADTLRRDRHDQLERAPRIGHGVRAFFFGRVCRSASRLLLLGARVGHGPARTSRRTSRTGAKMMFGKHVVTICAVAAALVAGCNNPKRDQEKADQAQREA